MKRSFFRVPVYVLATALSLWACDSGPVGPADRISGTESLDRGREIAVPVLSLNVYHGAPLDPLFDPEVSGEQIPFLVADIWNLVQATDFEARARALAEEIDAARPVTVGLQEVALYRIQTPGDALFGGTVPATQVAMDYLQILLDALAERGLAYEVAASVQNIDAEVPMYDPASPTGFSDIRLTDFDVILVRSDVRWSDPRGANFGTSLPVEIGPISLSILRGWTSVAIDVGGTSIRVFNTHPEAFHPAVRDAQLAEILALLANEPLPIVLVGDLNTEPSESGYGILTSAGFEDAWSQSSAGFTCCQAPDLRNESSSLSERIDYVLLRGDFPFAGESGFTESVHAQRIGERPSDRTDSGLWPSDHAGVVATIKLHPSDG